MQIHSRLKKVFHEEFEKFCIVVFSRTETWKRLNYTVEAFFQSFPKPAKDLLSPCMAKKRALPFRYSTEDEGQAEKLLDMVEKLKAANNHQFFHMKNVRKPQKIPTRPDETPQTTIKRHGASEAAELTLQMKLYRFLGMGKGLHPNSEKASQETSQESGKSEESKESSRCVVQ